MSNCLLLFGPYFVSAWFVLLKMCTRRPMPSTRRKHSRCVCLANSRVGQSINARKPFFFGFFRSRMIGTRNAAVLPLPVGAQAISDFPCLRKVIINKLWPRSTLWPVTHGCHDWNGLHLNRGRFIVSARNQIGHNLLWYRPFVHQFVECFNWIRWTAAMNVDVMKIPQMIHLQMDQIKIQKLHDTNAQCLVEPVSLSQCTFSVRSIFCFSSVITFGFRFAFSLSATSSMSSASAFISILASIFAGFFACWNRKRISSELWGRMRLSLPGNIPLFWK